MEFNNVIKNRTAVRKFTEKKIDEKILNQILEAGRIAPTAKNIQPIKIYVVNSAEGLNKIDNSTKCRYGTQTVLIVCGNKEEAYHKGEYSTYEMDSCIVATHMMLEATNLGIDNIWVEAFENEILRKDFEIPEELIPVMLLPLGYKSEDCPNNPLHNIRKKLEEIVEYK
ncbi:MAG: nitroreductase family protein [Clostridium sp.]|nr:nitroreductase family protein [Clostridium sp.]